jgi:ribosomal protein S12 methylthiotransferase accessory factor
VPGYGRGLDERELRRRHRFAALVSPGVGLIDHVDFLPLDRGAVELEVASTSLGDLHHTFAHVPATGGPGEERGMGGGSADVDAERSWVRAVVEGAERYSMVAFDESDFVVATARELGTAAIDIAALPRCSPAEYADPRCPLWPAPLDEPIRWVRGLSLLDGAERLVPAVITHLHLAPWPEERFWLPISTGVAAHTSVRAALVAAICENVERDAMALWWLLERPLPRIAPPAHPSASLAAVLARLARSTVDHRAFDATTDLGIPTVLGVQLDDDPERDLFVSAATALDPEVAYEKAIREASPGRAVLRGAPPCPPDVRDFTALTDGAVHYGRTRRRDDFDFLLRAPATTTLQAMAAAAGPTADGPEAAQLEFLLGRLRAAGMDPVAVDLTADEVREAGLWVLRVIVPELVPISFVHRARYLGTPRLLARAGAGPAAPPTVNPHPLPFA